MSALHSYLLSPRLAQEVSTALPRHPGAPGGREQSDGVLRISGLVWDWVISSPGGQEWLASHGPLPDLRCPLRQALMEGPINDEVVSAIVNKIHRDTPSLPFPLWFEAGQDPRAWACQLARQWEGWAAAGVSGAMLRAIQARLPDHGVCGQSLNDELATVLGGVSAELYHAWKDPASSDPSPVDWAVIDEISAQAQAYGRLAVFARSQDGSDPCRVLQNLVDWIPRLTSQAHPLATSIVQIMDWQDPQCERLAAQLCEMAANNVMVATQLEVWTNDPKLPMLRAKLSRCLALPQVRGLLDRPALTEQQSLCRKVMLGLLSPVSPKSPKGQSPRM